MGLTWVALGMVHVVGMLCVSPGRLVVDAATEKIEAGGLISLSNREHTWAPYMTLSAPFTEIESITSHFSFRTYDPEGLVFYGDSNDGKDWFVLSLRGGIPEMQFGKSSMMVTVSGGPKLNNGVWHKLELYSEGEFVVLKVDNKPELRVGMHQDKPGPGREGFIRLALGGLLIDHKKLLIPINPLLDACIRDGNWLSLSTPWDITPKKKEIPCSPDIKPGSFFSGGGLVVFNTSAFAFDSINTVNITVLGSSNKWNGTILSMWSYHTNSRVVSVGEDAEEERLYFTINVGDMAIESKADKDFKNFQMTIEKDSITVVSRLQQHVTARGRIPVNGILEQWKEGMPLAFGGLLGKGGDHHDASAYMTGCLDAIFIQGQKLDLDHALFKDRLYHEVNLGGIALEGDSDKDFKSFQLTIEKDSITFESRLEQHVTGGTRVTVNGILEQWEEGMPLAFGGLLGEGGDHHDASAYMTGCLDAIFIQGQKLDLDHALFKDVSVSSHSCPV